MKNKFSLVVGALAIFGSYSLVTTLSSRALANPATQEKQEKGEGKEKPMTTPVAKIGPIAAMKAATSKTGGKAAVAIFEFDEGHWVYGVITVKNHKLEETEIDPVTGKVLASEPVTADGEAKEFAGELAKLTK